MSSEHVLIGLQWMYSLLTGLCQFLSLAMEATALMSDRDTHWPGKAEKAEKKQNHLQKSIVFDCVFAF